MPTDRAQDTEAIRAAPPVEGEVPAQWYLDMRAERDRLEARLEAAETRLSVAHAYIPSRDFADYEGDANAALAAAAPGECDGSPTCAADEHVENCVAGWATGAAPGEAEQTP